MADYPDEKSLPAELAGAYLDAGDLEQAKVIIAQLDDGQEGVTGLQCRLKFYALAAELPARDSLQSSLGDEGVSAETCYQLAIHHLTGSEFEQALERLLEAMSLDRQYDDGVIQKTLLDVFNVLGKASPLVSPYRRKMYNLLH